MIDKLRLALPYTRQDGHCLIPQIPFNVGNVLLRPAYDQNNEYVVACVGRLNNLHFKYDGLFLWLTNSIHKYYSGNNYSDFDFDAFNEAITSLCSATRLDWRNAFVKQIEYGCNIRATPSGIYNSLVSYKGRGFGEMERLGKRYGMYCNFNEYRLKAYDKTYESSINGGEPPDCELFRWEVFVRKTRLIEQILKEDKVRVAALLKKDTWRVLSKDALNRFCKIVRSNSRDLGDLTVYELKVLGGIENPETRAALKNGHPHSYKKIMDTYRKSISKLTSISVNDPAILIEQKLFALAGSHTQETRIVPACSILGKMGKIAC